MAAIQAARAQIRDAEKQIDTFLSRILGTTNPAVIGAYEEKIGDLERTKARFTDQLAKHAEPKGSFEEKLEPALIFLANPWRLWETGQIPLRRAVPHMAFTDHLHYCRKEGARTPEIALPFKVLGEIQSEGVCFGALQRTTMAHLLR